MAELGPRELLALPHDRREAGIGGDLPFHRQGRHRHAAMDVEGIGSQAGPDHEPVRRRLAGGDAEAERILAPDRLRMQNSRGGESGRAGARDELTASEHPIPLETPIRCRASYTLNRNSITSPSCTTYSLPSARILPASLAPASPPKATKSSKAIVSARMKPRSKSVWMTPAASGARAPFSTVQARASFGPAVKKVIRCRRS